MIFFALTSFVISIAGLGIVLLRHWDEMDALTQETHEMLQADLTIFEESAQRLQHWCQTIWHTKFRERAFTWFGASIAFLETYLKRLVALLGALKRKLRRRQLADMRQTQNRYWTDLNAWNERRLRLRLGRRKAEDK